MFIPLKMVLIGIDPYGSIPHCLDYRTFGGRGLESKLNGTGLSQLKMQNHDATCAISENSPDIRYHYGTLT